MYEVSASFYDRAYMGSVGVLYYDNNLVVRSILAEGIFSVPELQGNDLSYGFVLGHFDIVSQRKIDGFLRVPGSLGCLCFVRDHFICCPKESLRALLLAREDRSDREPADRSQAAHRCSYRT